MKEEEGRGKREKGGELIKNVRPCQDSYYFLSIKRCKEKEER